MRTTNEHLNFDIRVERVNKGVTFSCEDLYQLNLLNYDSLDHNNLLAMRNNNNSLFAHVIIFHCIRGKYLNFS